MHFTPLNCDEFVGICSIREQVGKWHIFAVAFQGILVLQKKFAQIFGVA